MERSGSPLSATAGARPGASDPVDVFVSHVEEDAGVALALADALEGAGFSTWCYERDSIPGPSYLLQTAQAIERSRAVVVVISAHSLGSNQVTAEVVRAHEAVKPFVPVLVGITHVEFAARQPEWREAIGSATSITVPAGGVDPIVPRIVNGLRALGIVPGEPHAPTWHRTEPVLPLAHPSVPHPTAPGGRPRWLLGAVVLAVVALLAVGLLVLRGGGEKAAESPGPTPTAQPTGQVTEQPTGQPSVPTGAVADASRTPIQTSQGPARISSATLQSRVCPPSTFPGECKTAPSGSRFLVLDIHAWGSGDLVFNEALSMEAIGSYVSYQGRRASPIQTWLLEASPSGFRVVYASLPAEAAGKDVNLFWQDSAPLRFRPRG
jgi:hypothetical protein